MNLYSVPSLILYSGPTLKVARLQSCPQTVPPWIGLRARLSFCFCRIPVQTWFIISPSLGSLMGDSSSGPFLSCLLAAVPLCCVTAPFFINLASCLDPGWALLLQTHLVVTRPGLTSVISSELLDSPCALPVPAATLGYLFSWPTGENSCSLLGKAIRANNTPFNINGNVVYLNLLSKSSSALIDHSEAFRNEPKSSFSPQQVLSTLAMNTGTGNV